MNNDSTTTQQSPPVEKNDPKTATPEETRQELQQAIEGSNDVLIKCSTSLTMFPDTLILDRAKLTVTKRSFVSTAEVISMRIEDILNVTATVGPLFGTVQITSRVVNSSPYEVGKFHREDALKIKRVAQGYVIALQRKIDCNALSTKELVDMLDKLGEDDHSSNGPGID